MAFSFASDKVNFSSTSAANLAIDSPPAEGLTNSSTSSTVHSLAALWARKYYIAVTSDDELEQEKGATLAELSTSEGLAYTANKLLQNLTLASAQAWSLTETLLSKEIRRHGINPDLINPLEIAADTRSLFEKAFVAYAGGVAPSRLSVELGRDIGKVRQKYTNVDPRAIGFVSMQFHYTGQKLLEILTPLEQSLFAPYVKVMDDHMYMPLPAAYAAAAKHDYNSPALLAVRGLLPISSKIAATVCDRVSRTHLGYETFSGKLTDAVVRISSIRDAEMFQVYLCLCALENSFNSVQSELFPLCVMLYPQLKVRWTLVQEMITMLSWEIHAQLPTQDMAVFLPYLRTFSEMFSNKIFEVKG